eukprot:TRINITY_DN55349_c0_g1_i1.p1 TRINITY_DN55349_c0_g1~~TRINITY_DN55349_c0_g1_i1.p1  ORF type:complete len:601 (+),score=71.77 TRINITY_DN55349_c0_g1_i1:26-1804(+)
MPVSRAIIHYDVDCFYAQVEMVRDPSLAEIPMGVQQNQTISTANYRARQMGVHKMMHIKEALAVCPSLRTVQGNMDSYRKASERIRDFFEEILPEGCEMEVGGMDELWWDATTEAQRTLVAPAVPQGTHVWGAGCTDPLLIAAAHLANNIRRVVHERLGYTVSAGIAENKLLAKMASQMHKPNDQTVLPTAYAADYLATLPVRRFPGVGRQTETRLKEAGILTAADVLEAAPEKLQCIVGLKLSQQLRLYCRGIDTTEVAPRGNVKSIGAEQAFLPLSTVADVEAKALTLSELCASRFVAWQQRQETPIRPSVIAIRLGLGSFESPYVTKSAPFSNKGTAVTVTAKNVHQQTMTLFNGLVPSHVSFKLFRLGISLSGWQTSDKSKCNTPSILRYFAAPATRAQPPAEAAPPERNAEAGELSQHPSEQSLFSSGSSEKGSSLRAEPEYVVVSPESSPCHTRRVSLNSSRAGVLSIPSVSSVSLNTPHPSVGSAVETVEVLCSDQNDYYCTPESDIEAGIIQAAQPQMTSVVLAPRVPPLLYSAPAACEDEPEPERKSQPLWQEPPLHVTAADSGPPRLYCVIEDSPVKRQRVD